MSEIVVGLVNSTRSCHNHTICLVQLCDMIFLAKILVVLAGYGLDLYSYGFFHFSEFS